MVALKDREWFKKVYRRNVVDMHIADWDENFLSEFNAKKYVEALALARVESTVVYATSHMGLCYYPTKIGAMHKGLRGRDILGEVIDLCHENGINVVVYYSLIFNVWAYDAHPDWRIIRADGKEAAENSRYGVCCPNSPYRDFAIKQVEEICKNYDFEGIRFDMTFWPTVCYCKHCQEKYSEEVGGEIPRIVNWLDQKWVTFQRKREKWLIDFAALITSTVRRIKPEVTAEHQSSTYDKSWLLSVTQKLSEQCDFLQGDFYGGLLEESFACKLFHNLTKNKPCAFETSSNVSLTDHTTLKPKELLELEAYAAIANGAAFVFIDAINPDGTLNESVYYTMREIFEEIEKYEKYLGGEPIADAAIYFSTESKFDLADNGKNVMEASQKMPHLESALNVAESFIRNHIPFTVITKKNLGSLSSYKVLVLPNVLMMDEEEAEAFREFVKNGGVLYASKHTSLIRKDGKMGDFLLSDLLGVSYLGETKESFTYISPIGKGEEVLLGYSSKYPLSIYGSQLKVEAREGAEVLGKIILPYTDPADTKHFASIHSNPPGKITNYPAIILNNYGKGRAIYITGDLDRVKYHQNTFIRLIRLLYPKSFSFESDAPGFVEMTLFDQKNHGRYIITLLNLIEECIPIRGINVKIALNGKKPERFLKLPEEKELNYKEEEGRIEFNAAELKRFVAFALNYR
ncbi:MAG: beta-galactosidase trimerization domain-containing protein [Candidatus Bathyarchaeia archaeon]